MTFWYQESRINEPRYVKQRIVRNRVSLAVTNWNVTVAGAGSTPIVTDDFAADPGGELTAVRAQLEAGGITAGDRSEIYNQVSSTDGGRPFCMSFWFRLNAGTSRDVELVDNGSALRAITVTDVWQRFSFTIDTAGTILRLGVRARGDISGATLVDLLIADGTNYGPQIEFVPTGFDVCNDFVNRTIVYNMVAAGLRAFNTTNGIVVNIDGVVSESPGALIVGGGYLPEPLATNQIPTNDMTDAAWGQSGELIRTDEGFGSLGLNQYKIDAGVLAGVSHSSFVFADVGGAGTAYCIAQPTTGIFLNQRRGQSVTTDYACYDVPGLSVPDIGGGMGAASIEAIGQYRQCNCETTDNNVVYELGISDTGTPGTQRPIFDGANESFLMAHSQYENTPYWTSPIVTSGTAEQRGADVLDSGVVIASEFGALIDFTAPSIIGSGETISLLGASTSSVDILRIDDIGNVIMDDGGTPVTIGTVSVNQRFKVSYGRDATGRSASLDGASAVTGGAPSAAHEGETFELFSTAGANQARGIGHLVKIYEVRPSDAELQNLAA